MIPSINACKRVAALLEDAIHHHKVQSQVMHVLGLKGESVQHSLAENDMYQVRQMLIEQIEARTVKKPKKK